MSEEETNYVCPICGYESSDNDDFYFDTDHAIVGCHDCSSICEMCDRIVSNDDITEVEGDYICSDCVDEHTGSCDDCGEQVYNRHLYYMNGDDRSVCSSCRDNYYECEGCNRLYHSDQLQYDERTDCSYCEDCYEELPKNEMHSYSYKPYPTFYGTTKDEGFAFEIETDEGKRHSVDQTDYVNALLALYHEKYFYMKEDGSLSSNGVEVVTHVGSANWWIRGQGKEVLTHICQTAKDNHYCSHDAQESCGLHIHASKELFGENKREVELSVLKIVVLMDRFWDNLIVPISRRSKHDIDHWSPKYDLANKADISERSRKNGHYRNINVTNATVELRIFRGTIKIESIFSALEFYQSLIRIATTQPLDTILNIQKEEFISLLIKDTEYLSDYMKKRGINVPLFDYSERIEEYSEIYNEVSNCAYASAVSEINHEYLTHILSFVDEIIEE